MANRNSIQIINLHTWFKSYVEYFNHLEENINLRQLIAFLGSNCLITSYNVNFEMEY